MPKNCIVDTGPLVALLDPREAHHSWARETLARERLPWFTCESVVSECFYLLQAPHASAFAELLRRGHLRFGLNLSDELTQVLALRAKYADIPMSLTDACLVRLSEILPESIVVTTDQDFRSYRRHSRRIIPCLMP